MKRIISIGGGEIRNKTTLKIDEYIASLIKNNPKDGNRGNLLFLGTASHDSMPYFNSVRKTYTSVFDIKTDVALMVYGEMDKDKIQSKIDKADAIYVGGGDTIFMLKTWAELGVTEMIKEAYQKGTILCGLSAGAICWFKDMYTDSDSSGENNNYNFHKGLNYIDSLMTPHYDNRIEDFDKNLLESDYNGAFAVENNCAIEFVDEKFTKSISAGGKAFYISKKDGKLIKEEL